MKNFIFNIISCFENQFGFKNPKHKVKKGGLLDLKISIPIYFLVWFEKFQSQIKSVSFQKFETQINLVWIQKLENESCQLDSEI